MSNVGIHGQKQPMDLHHLRAAGLISNEERVRHPVTHMQM
jgi:hypothetical protein